MHYYMFYVADHWNCLSKTGLKKHADTSPLDGSMKLLIAFLILFKIKSYSFSHDLKFLFLKTCFCDTFPVLNVYCPFGSTFTGFICILWETILLRCVGNLFTFLSNTPLLHFNSFVFSKTFVFVQIIYEMMFRTRTIPAACPDKYTYLVTL